MTSDPALLTGAYAVDALSPEERREFERHMSDCPECAEEISELQATAARLGATAATTPPESLKSRVLSEVATTRQAPPTEREEPRPEATVTRIPTRAAWGTRLAVAAAVLGVALAGVFGAIAYDSHQQRTVAEQQMQDVRERGATMTEIMEAPDAETLTASEGGLRATTVLSDGIGKAMFLGNEVTPPPEGSVYQLWFIGEYGYESAGLLQQDPSGSLDPLIAQLPAETQAMGVTVEPTGGSPQPTTNPVLTMDVPA
ncbi:anti-sigma factor [Allosaccharopolyspora coralli]|uniref:Regulator of SigK n=1 Tax=Allosaccharopolyspora coralli TaxID=2665642 RepID=A0A5Q3Q5I6_9PSEU|nr:anti-sigma factor [Allosaccharopolyspora coralli]QGK69080.1 anti-sigma factor [Allosaccharopolyspora coralli]